MLFRKSPEQLMSEAQQALEQLDFRKASRIADQLLRMQHTSGFEYKARALWGMNRPNDAIAVLQQGVAVAPQVWVLWGYLGEYLSDTGRYDEALEAFRKGLSCDGSPKDSFLYNLAIVYQRMGEHENALQMLDQAEGVIRELPVPLLETARAYSFIHLQRYSEAERALQRAQRTLDALTDPQARISIEAMMLAYTGLIHHKRDNDSVLAKQYAERAPRLDKENPDAIALMRATNPIAEKPTPLWHILVEGVWSEPLEGVRTPVGFFTNYWVVADTPDEALEYIRPFEPPSARASLKVSEAEIEDTVQGELKGVVRTQGGYVFFTEGN
jgi:tetratricopeptide (TPR) repeat protein